MQSARLLTVVLFIFFINNLFAQPFEKDTFFGENGEMILSGGRSMSVTNDDKIILARGGGNEILIERMDKDGVYDEGFGTNGLTLLNFEVPIRITRQVIQLDGKILLVGSLKDTAEQWQALVIRLHENGQRDTNFGQEGIVVSHFEDLNVDIRDITYQEDGKLVVVGQSYVSRQWGVANPDDGIIIRYNKDGSLDETFGNRGIVSIDFDSKGDILSEVEILSNGKIIAAGDFESKLRERDFGLVRYTSEGILDTTFGEGGIVKLNFNLASDYLTYMTILEDNKILVGGSANNRVKEDAAFAQFLSNGELDITFGEGGIVLTDLSGFSSQALQSSDRPTCFLRRPDGRILLFGNMHTSKFVYDYEGFFLQYTEEGQLDQGFGNQGKLVTGPFDRFGITSLANQSDGKIIAIGNRQPSPDRVNFITRFLPDLNVGTIDFSAKLNNTLVYPNPIQTTATLEYTLEKTEKLTIQLADLNGRILKNYLQNEHQEAGEYQQTISIPANLPHGIYLLRLASENGQFTIKVEK